MAITASISRGDNGSVGEGGGGSGLKSRGKTKSRTLVRNEGPTSARKGAPPLPSVIFLS